MVQTLNVTGVLSLQPDAKEQTRPGPRGFHELQIEEQSNAT
jgi:hypothetical protein